MFNVAGQQGNIPCTASGTNAITLTPSTNYYLPTSYTIAQIASFKAVATSNASVTLQIGGLSLLKVFVPAGTQAASGDIVSASHYTVQYWADLDSGNGGWLILNSQLPAVASPVASSFTNLKLITSSDSTLTPTANAIIVQNASGGTARLTSVAPAVTSTASVGTANGIIGAVATSTWYSFWFIYNPNASLSNTNPGGWLDTSFTTPTPPAGYTYYARFGAFLTDGSAHLHRILQYGKRAQYVVSASTTTSIPTITNGTIGTYSVTSPTLVATSVSAFVPPTASSIWIMTSPRYNNQAQATGTEVAPSQSWSGTNNGPNGTNKNTYPFWTGATDYSNVGSMILEATTISIAATGAGSAVACLGWDDNL